MVLIERHQRRIDRPLDEAEEAVKTHDWAAVVDRSRAALALDADRADAPGLLATAHEVTHRL